jgi:hypothetical protein
MCLSWETNDSVKTLIIIWSTFWVLSFLNPNTWHLICNNFNLNFIFGIVCLCVCLRILASSRIPRYDFGRQTSHFWGGSVTATLSVMSDSLSLQSSRSMFVVLLWFRGFVYGYDYIIIMIVVFTYLWHWHGLTFCLFMHVLVCRWKHSIWLNLKWLK